MGRVPRRKHTEEFKLGAVKLVLEKEMSRAEVARDLGLSPSLVTRWVDEFRKDSANAFPGQGHLKPDAKRIRDLEEQVRILKMERDILKKATAYFAKLSD